MRDRYGASSRSQQLKYHIQTSGRSLHAQEIQFNDIRTTIQALLALYDNCNSLHTNAFDEAITTPTEGLRAPRDGDPADRHARVWPAQERERPPRQLHY
jgi:methylmalonyl-CoA mutase N-terminal domain/subunit